MKYIATLLFLICTSAFGINLTEVKVNCAKSKMCSFFKKNSFFLIRKYSSRKDFLNVLSVYYSNRKYKHLSYQLKSTPEGEILIVDVNFKKTIRKIKVTPKTSLNIDLVASLAIRPGDYLDKNLIKRDQGRVKKILKNEGYLDSVVELEVRPYDDFSVDLIYSITRKRPDVLRKIVWKCDGAVARSFSERFFNGFINNNFNREEYLKEVKNVEEGLISQGFYFSRLQSKVVREKKNISLYLDCGNTERVFVEINDETKNLSKKDFYLELRSSLMRNSSGFSVNIFKANIERILERKGFFKPNVEIESTFDLEDGQNVRRVTVNIKEVTRRVLDSINFKGNSFFSTNYLKKLYHSDSTSLVSGGYFDKDYNESFIGILKREYSSNGYLSPRVRLVVRSLGMAKSEVNYAIDEGYQSVVKKVDFDIEQSEEIKSVLRNFKIKEGSFFNPILFSKEVANLIENLKKRGYFYATLKNSGNAQVVRYKKNNRDVFIKISIELGKKLPVKSLIVSGLYKTESSVIKRKLNYVESSFLNPILIRNIKKDLASLGIFKNQQVEIIHSSDDSFVNIVVNVEEKKYGTIELAPGFRTDLGAKIWARFARSNLFGRNQTISLTSQINSRLSLGAIEDSRQNKRFIEFLGEVNYDYPDFFKSYWDYSSALSASRKRFFSFDADIFRLTNTFRRTIGRKFSLQLIHRLENIRQFNSSTLLDGSNDDGKFKIGSLTPSFGIDLRDNPVLPRSGGQFQISYEIAKPYFLSQNNEDLKIDFTKIISRNKFYFNISENFYFAGSVAMGVQKNLASDIRTFGKNEGSKEGFIPSIKVFRLTGVDIVRGYAEDEINVVESIGLDISDLIIDNKAYMANIKLEPRYMLNDSMMLGVFFDAGSVQVNKFQPLKLRTSAGISFKYVTPVGTLDLDYGFKLDRGIKPDGSRETPGRFHLSIGFF